MQFVALNITFICFKNRKLINHKFKELILNFKYSLNNIERIFRQVKKIFLNNHK